MNKSILPKIIGLIVFVISWITYFTTLEPTTSFWDCSEFISCGYNLEVGHAPGAPLFMLFSRLFSLFAGGDVTQVAHMVNIFSGTGSALTIFFLYWTLVWFIKKWMAKSVSDYTPAVKTLAVYGSAALGALAFAFTDSFWFSAVEGEVYATSSMFTAVAFWAVTKWEEASEEKNGNKWIVLIFYLLGLSVGVHLLNTLIIPAMALVFYYKKYKPTTRGIIFTLILSFILILILIFGVVPGVVSLAAYFDLLFVNSFGAHLYVGAITFVVLLIATLYLIHRYSVRKGKIVLKIAILSLSFWLIGYSSYALLVIRSASNPFIDINNCENLFGLVDYLNREQYGQRPLIYGNNYNSPVINYKERFTYKMYDGKYFKDKLNPEYIFDDRTLTLFPRMASMDQSHIEAYQSWVNIKGRPVDVKQQDGTDKTIMVPTFAENFTFFLKYQVGFMYFRYFMWNFSGRQDDIQGHGGVLHGNWITGIPFIDKSLVGPSNPSLNTVDQNKSRAVFFMLPLLLGLIGLTFHLKKDKENFLVNSMLFLLTGIAIAVYLNEVPITPRERDYAYVGSFYAFAIWIGLGCFAIIESFTVLRKSKIAAFATFFVLFLSVPVWMLYQNYSCHDRSNRYTVRDYARDIVESCDKDAILFTTADNDTYPVWYIQEVEGVRRDVREILEPFLPVDWYAEQFNNKFEGKKDMKFGYRGKELLMDNNQYFPIIEKIDTTIDLSEAMEFIKSDDPRAKVEASDNTSYNYLPGKKITFKVNKSNFLKSCSYAKLTENQIPDAIKFQINKKSLSRDELFILNIIAKNDWERPIYFISPDFIKQIGLSDYIYQEGLLYRISPFKGGIPPELAHSQALYQYDLLKNKFKWGNVNSKSIYLDQMNVSMVSMLHFRELFANVAKILAYSKENEKANEVLNMEETIFPKDRIPYSFEIPQLVDAYYAVGNTQKGDQIALDVSNYFDQKLTYYAKLNEYFKESVTGNDAAICLYILQNLIKTLKSHNSSVKTKVEGVFMKFYKE